MTGYIGIDALMINEENKLQRRVEALTEKQDEIKKLISHDIMLLKIPFTLVELEG